MPLPPGSLSPCPMMMRILSSGGAFGQREKPVKQTCIRDKNLCWRPWLLEYCGAQHCTVETRKFLSLVDSSPALCRDLNTKASWVRHWQSRDTQPGPLGQIQPRVVHFALNVVVRPLQRKKLTEHQDSAQSLASNPTCCVGWNADMLDTCVSSRQSFDGKTDTMFRPAEWC